MTSLVDETDHADLTEYNRQNCTDHMKGLMVALTAGAWQQDIILYLICGVAFFMVYLRSTYTWESSRLLRQRKGHCLTFQQLLHTYVSPSTISARFLRGQASSFSGASAHWSMESQFPRYSVHILHSPWHVAHSDCATPLPDSRGDSLHTLNWNELECTVRYSSYL